MKKTITIILIVILLFNLIPTKTYAANGLFEMFTGEEGIPISDDFLTSLDKGNGAVTNADGQTKLFDVTGTLSFKGGIVTVLSSAFGVIPQILKYTLDTVTQEITQDKNIEFTVYNIVMGNISLFNLDFHKVPNVKLSELDKAHVSPNDVLKITATTYYFYLRDFSLALSLVILIYVGIRMAISTVASDKAKYNKMLIGWLSSVVLLMLMHFIIIIVCYLLDRGRDLLILIAGPNGLNINDIEVVLWARAIKDILTVKGFDLVVALILLIMITYYKIKFFILYLMRFLEVSFLVLIAPLITVTYPIDKIGDNKAQAFSAWFKELLSKASLQLMHGIVYCVFIATAGVIIEYFPLLVIFLFASLTRIEKIVRNIFSLKDKSIDSVKIPFIN